MKEHKNIMEVLRVKYFFNIKILKLLLRANEFKLMVLTYRTQISYYFFSFSY